MNSQIAGMSPLFLSKMQIIELTGLADRTIDRMEQAGRFPKRVKLGARKVGWRYVEIMEWADNLQ